MTGPGTPATPSRATPSRATPSPSTVSPSTPTAKAEVLLEALPYVRRFRGEVVVVKYGGSAVDAPEAGLQSFASDVAALTSVGVKIVVIHGGGPQIGEMMTRLGKVPEFRDGQRVTDEETLDIVRMVLVGRINRDLVGALNASGTPSVGLSGEDASLLRVTPMHDSLGFVGQVEEVHPDILTKLLAEGLVPVVATIGTDEEGQAYNVNADLAAGAVAAALGAAKLVYLTDVEGLRRDPADPASVISSLSAKELDALTEGGGVTGGMIPKVRSCLDALAGGVGEAHILDGRAEHALLLELFTPEGVGTMVTP